MHKPLAIAAFASLALAACARPQPDEQEQALAQSQQRAAADARPAAAGSANLRVDAGSCDATQAQWVVGRPMAQADAAQAGNDARAGVVRILKPGQAVTLEYNAARLNIDVDEKGVVTAVRCG